MQYEMIFDWTGKMKPLILLHTIPNSIDDALSPDRPLNAIEMKINYIYWIIIIIDALPYKQHFNVVAGQC